MNNQTINNKVNRNDAGQDQENAELNAPKTPLECKSSSISNTSKKSRKISKKREKYKKIDDEIRLKLVEAVEKNGEMLKTAAKRFKINYSSAKSIFHTYRKEGRILKKLVKDRYKKKPSLAIQSNQTQQLNVNPVFDLQNPNYENTNNQTPNLTSLSNIMQPQLSTSIITNFLLGSPFTNNQLQQQQQQQQQQQPTQKLIPNLANEPNLPPQYNKYMETLIAMRKLQQITRNPRMNMEIPANLADKLINEATPSLNQYPNLHPNNIKSILQSFPQNNNLLNKEPTPNHFINHPLQTLIAKNNYGMVANLNIPPQNEQILLYPNQKNLELQASRAIQAQAPPDFLLNVKKIDSENRFQNNGFCKTTPEFECKKEFTPSKADTTDDLNLESRDGIMKPEVIRESILPLSPINPHLENFQNLRIQKIENDNNNNLKQTIDTAAIDTFKTALNAQILLGEALKKAALLNSLINIQSGGFPKVNL